MPTKIPSTEFVGKTFGRLTITKDVGYLKKNRMVLAVCKCGTIKRYYLGHVKAGKIVSCGCKNKENIIQRNTKHELKHHPLYVVWCAMKSRCYYKNNISFKRYGGRGISVCKEWINDFKAFYDWAKKGYKPELNIDRINNDGNYEPRNCRWVTDIESRRNTSNNRLIKYDGKVKCITEWAEIIGIPASRIYDRLNKLGWSVEQSFTTRIKKNQYSYVDSI